MKGLDGFSKKALEAAGFEDAARIGFRIKALDESGFLLGLPDQSSQANLFGIEGELNSASTTTLGVEVPEFGKVVNDLSQVVPRDAEGFGYLVQDESLLLQGGEHQDAQGVIAEKAESHGATAREGTGRVLGFVGSV